MSIKDVKRNYVIDVATKIFIEKSLANVTIKDVAAASGFGEATVYRYFGGRSGLIVACTMKLQEEVCRIFTDWKDLTTGYARIEQFYNSYLKMFLERPELYRFLSEFDAYCISEGVDDLDEYADNMDVFKEAFRDSYQEGRKDGSVKEIPDIETFYYSTTHAMLELGKRLAADDAILRQDRLTDRARELQTLADVILSYVGT